MYIQAIINDLKENIKYRAAKDKLGYYKDC